MKKLILILGVIVGCAILAKAQNTPAIKEKQKAQMHRINEGVSSGELTRSEVRKVKAEQRQIRTEKQLAKADRVITPRERHHIKRDQKKASCDIYRQKHDNQSAN